MKTPARMVSTAITLPPALLKDAILKANMLHGPRGFSRYIRALIMDDLNKPRRN